MRKTKILVTGGAGFIGSAIVHELSKEENNLLVVVDNLLTGDIKRIPEQENVQFINADVNDFADISSIFFNISFDYVFHYAAVVGVKRTLDNPIMVLDDLKGIRNVCELSRKTKVKRINGKAKTYF